MTDNFYLRDFPTIYIIIISSILTLLFIEY